ncbi:asparagine synthase-related protein [Ruegeria sp. SCPT10]|uniref:asparagine synthetase B family protein n=1 Tax=Ruegeria sp. SCP10 TaxID=3141377 RepID=UPI00333DC187
MFGVLGAGNGCSPLSAMHRLVPGGPDEQNLRWGNGWVLGHTRLAINGVLNGSQPYTSPGLHGLFVGEIYNYKELASRFGISLSTSGTDGEVILPLFAKFGPDFVRHLEGMFSIAIMDVRDVTSLYLYTDSCAIKPVYYLPKHDTLGFASEIEGLPNFEDDDREIHANAFDRYGAYRAMLGRQTIFPSVKVLEPGTYLTFRNGKTEIIEYTPNAALFAEGADTVRDFEHDFGEGVKKTLMTDVPVCTTLSGGLDSSLVATLASNDPRMTHAYNVWYQGNWKEDETAYAREVAAASGLEYQQVTVRHDRFPDQIQAMCRSLSQPNAAAHCLSTFELYEAIGKAGFKVALVGEGADDFFGGYDRMYDIAVSNGDDDAINAYVSDLAAIKPDLRKNLVSDDAQNARLGEEFTDFLNSLPGDSLIQKVLHFEARHRLPYYILHRVDALSMAHSVEARVPFCLPTVYRHALFAQDKDLIGAGRRKAPIYRAGSSVLPASVINRPKQPFLLPIAGMFQPGYPVYDLLMDTIATPSVTAPIVNVAALREMVERNQQSPSNKLGNAIWAWLIFELWGQEHNVRIG